MPRVDDKVELIDLDGSVIPKELLGAVGYVVEDDPVSDLIKVEIYSERFWIHAHRTRTVGE